MQPVARRLAGYTVLAGLIACGDPQPSSPDSTDFDTSDAADAASDVVVTEPDAGTDADTDGGDPTLRLRLDAPLDGQSDAAVFGFEATPLGAFVDGVSFTIDGEPFSTDLVRPYHAIWRVDDVAEGGYDVGAFVVGEPAVVAETVRVWVDRTPPSVAFAAPQEGQATVDDTLLVELDIQDSSPIRSVRVVASTGASQVTAEVEGPPWRTTLEVEGLPSGELTLLAEVTDAAGRVTSLTRSVRHCALPAVNCDGLCVDTTAFAADPQNCGGCGLTCAPGAERCSDSACVCTNGTERCGTDCVTTRVNPNHCGACDVVCEDDESCVLGACIEGDRGEIAVGGGEYTQGGAPGFGTEPHEFQRDVTITQAFYLAATEVTHAQWLEHFDINPSEFWDCGDACPVESVTWWEALAYANALSESEGLAPCFELVECTGRPGATFRCGSATTTAESGNPLDCEGYRLPTEAEWELAYSAGDTTTYAGDVTSDACDELSAIAEIAWFVCNAGGTPHPVAQKAPNALGLYDMAGNVYEWTLDDWYSEVSGDPVTDPIVWEGTSERVFKGGGWNDRARRVRAGARLSDAPGEVANYVGFRVARSLLEAP